MHGGRCTRGFRSPVPRISARASGKGAGRRSLPWAACHRTTTCRDGVIPRTKLPEVLSRIRSLAAESGLKIGNVFHAGDGNLHPLVCYDDGVEGQGELAQRVASEILTICLDVGGSITGEHGVGADKMDQMPKMFSEIDLDTMQLVRCAFDPSHLCNPGKVFPTPRLCGEVPRSVPRSPRRSGGSRRAPVSPLMSTEALCSAGRLVLGGWDR